MAGSPCRLEKERIANLLIVHLYETTATDRLPLDMLVEARAAHQAPMKKIEVMFSEMRPEADQPLPVLWMREGDV